MAAAIYPKFKEQALQGGTDLSGGNIKLVLVDTGAYTYSSSHQYLSDIAAGARIATSGNLASKTFTNGTFDAADVSISSVSGATVEAVVYYIDSGAAATSKLIFYDDTLTGLAFTPNGGTVNITFNASGIFTL